MKVQKLVPPPPKMHRMTNLMANLLWPVISSGQLALMLGCVGISWTFMIPWALKYYAKVSAYEQFSERSQNFH